MNHDAVESVTLLNPANSCTTHTQDMVYLGRDYFFFLLCIMKVLYISFLALTDARQTS